MNRKEYDDLIVKMLMEGPYDEWCYKNGRSKDPLNKMIEKTLESVKKLSQITGDERLKYRLQVSNPKVASLYCLPKIHKQPLAMRPISSNINTPTEKMAAWLLEKLQQYPVNFGCGIKNNVELVDKVKNVKLRQGEILVSFDVKNLFPSVPSDEAVNCLRNHLQKSGASPEEIEAYVLAATTCMSQNFFQFRGKFYQQKFGLSMGSKLSPYLANIFMSDFEERLKTHRLFPRVWLRYVDDVFAVVKEENLNELLTLINSQSESIQFTVEKEVNRSIPFLDLRITRTEDNKLSFSIYRKPTHTDRFITAESYHCGSHKKAAFHSMAHRLYNIPLTKQAFDDERGYIVEVAKKNGYSRKFIERIFSQHQRKKKLRDLTSLQPINETSHRISVPYCPVFTNSLKQHLRRHNIELVTTTTSTLKSEICNYKDRHPQHENSGIYSIGCNDCDQIYIGQTRRRIEKRVKEHIRYTKNGQVEKSGVAEHMQQHRHTIDTNNIKVIRTVRNDYHLDAFESLHISNSIVPLMNKEDPPLNSPLFYLSSLSVQL